MTTGTYSRPNYTVDLAASYKSKIDAMARVFERLGDWFAPHEQSAGSPSPDMTVVVDAGSVWDGTTLAEKAQQTVTGFTIPASGTRIDRICINTTTGDALRVTGTAVAGSPSATPPAIPSGHMPCCQVSIAGTDTAIANSMITDERVFVSNLSAAIQAEQEAGTSILVYTSPGRQQFHPSAAKGWVKATNAGGIDASYNVSSITDDGQGLLTVTWDVDFSSANYSLVATGLIGGGVRDVTVGSQLAGSCQLRCNNSADSLTDPTNWNVIACGDQ